MNFYTKKNNFTKNNLYRFFENKFVQIFYTKKIIFKENKFAINFYTKKNNFTKNNFYRK